MPDLSALRRSIAALEPSADLAATDLFGFGASEVDNALGGGLSRGALHEVYARQVSDAAATAGFGFCLALRAAGDRVLVWLRQQYVDVETGALHGDGVAAFGGDPAKLLMALLRDATEVLRAAGEAARCAPLGAVLVEIWGEPKSLDLTASRRLSLAATGSGVTLIMIRQAATPRPSAARSRWSVSSAVSTPLEANAPGPPAFNIELLRHRTGFSPRSWRLEWNRDNQSFAPAPLSRLVAAVHADRPTAPVEGMLWRRAG